MSPNTPHLVQVLRPAKGHTCILSPRRQFKKRMQRENPRLASGRQWTKFRKEVRRRTGVDFLTLPSFVLAKK